VSKPKPTPSPSPSQTTSQSPSPTPTDSPTTPTTVVVLSSEVLGLNKDEVQVALSAKGLQVNLIPGTPLLTGDPKINTIYEASPLGSMPTGTTVNLSYYVESTPETNPNG